jgi:hypothetical protein
MQRPRLKLPETVFRGFHGDHYLGLGRQLADGVRGINWDVYDVDGVPTLCHSICALGNRLLFDALLEVKVFLESNPDEILTIVFESYVTAEALQEAFEETGVLPFVHAQELGTPWPLLADMIAAEKRLVVFTDAGGGVYPWLHDVWAYAFETPYAAETPEDLRCSLNRGEVENAIFVLPHFLTAPLAAPELADQVNHNPFFIERVDECIAERNAIPRIIQVDFYSVGDVFEVVAALNQ